MIHHLSTTVPSSTLFKFFLDTYREDKSFRSGDVRRLISTSDITKSAVHHKDLKALFLTLL